MASDAKAAGGATGTSIFGKGRYLLLVLVDDDRRTVFAVDHDGAKNLGTWFGPRSADNAAAVAADPGGAAADGPAAKPAGASRRENRPSDGGRAALRRDAQLGDGELARASSADLAELDLQGYRVPLVSGTSEADVAGSLTYYFNAKQRLERITFFGTTGDGRKLVALLESRFAFKRGNANEPNLFLYQVKSWGKVQSEMRIRPSPIVRSEVPNTRFEVALLIDRPKSMK